jgi:ring-1,2-phenylacetyl-CoA epoxidase subunit PaaC
VLAQRLGEWCGHAPVLEEDIAMANIALDLVGQARALLTHAGKLEGEGREHDEDQLAYLRDERDYFNLTLVELPRGDFAFAVLRNTMVATLLKLLWQRLGASSDAEVAAIAGKAVKEARYHQQHSADWVVRLGDGTDESRRRTEKALKQLWLYVPELFESDAVDAQPAPAASARMERTARTLARRDAASARRGRPRDAQGSRVPQHRQARRAQRAHGLHPHRDAAPAAQLPRRRVVTADVMTAVARRCGVGRAAHGARPRGAGRVGVRPGHRARSDRARRRPGDRAHAHLLRLPRDRSHRARRAGRHRIRRTRPRTRHAAPRARLEQRLDQRRRARQAQGLRHRAARPPHARDAAPTRHADQALRPHGRRTHRLPALRERTHRALSAFGSTACKALYRCMACREPFEHFKPI